MINYCSNKITRGSASALLMMSLLIFCGYSPAPAAAPGQKAALYEPAGTATLPEAASRLEPALLPVPEQEPAALYEPAGTASLLEPAMLTVPKQETAAEKMYEVFVVQQRWHTGIVFRTKDVDPEIWPEIERYTDRNFVDVGWGDERFYQAMGDPVGLALRSMLFPTRSVLLVYPFNLPLQRTYGRDARIIRIPLNSQQFTALTRFVSDRYLRDEHGQARPSTIHGVSDLFFLAGGKYHVFNTCNTWVAHGFKAAGFRIRSRCVLNANQVFKQMERIPGSEYLRE
jgi:uncharacterized protein (TIGR02117 family)